MCRSKPAPVRHEAFIARIAELAISRLEADEQAKARSARIAYGSGAGLGARGVTFFGTWTDNDGASRDFVEICAAGEESPVQVAGTTIHEIGHVLAGPTAGHGPAWKAACARLGLRSAMAAGMTYLGAAFEPCIREAIAEQARLEGRPAFRGQGTNGGRLGTGSARPCSAGVGVRGGKSRGKGSGSRMRKWVCTGCEKPVIARVASDEFLATCGRCGTEFVQG